MNRTHAEEIFDTLIIKIHSATVELYALFHDRVVDGAIISAALSINLLTPCDTSGH